MTQQGMSFEVTGLRELERELAQMQPKLARRALGRAVSAGAALLRDKARQNARAQGLHRTGLLVRSISHRRVRVGNWRTTNVRRIYHSNRPYKAAGKQPYGMWYERGFVDRDSGMRTHRPHIRPAFDENQVEAANAIKERMATAIKQLWPHDPRAVRMYR